MYAVLLYHITCEDDIIDNNIYTVERIYIIYDDIKGEDYNEPVTHN